MVKSVYQKTKWKWLFDYINTVQTSLKTDMTVADNVTAWRYAIAAFFLQTEHNSWPATANFATAGKKEKWYPSTIHSESIDIDAEWRVCLNNFFNKTKETTDNDPPFIVDYTTNGKPEIWYSYWLSSFPPTPEKAQNKGIPTPIRKDHVFAGWYFGNNCTKSNPGYNIEAPVTNITYGCIYARWLELVLREGHVTDEQMIADQRKNYTNFNLDLIKVVADQAYDLQLDRKIVGGMYNTMCLPFAIAGKNEFANIKYANGNGTDKPFTSVNDFSLVKYTGTRVTDEAIVLTFQELGNDETLLANTPFLLKPNKDDITQLMQYGTAKTVEVVVRDQGQAVEDDGEGDDGEGDDGGGAIIPQTPAEYALTVSDANISYTGVLAPTTIPEGSVLLVANNRLAVSTGGEMKGMRGFFSPLALPIQQPMAIQITTKDGATTYLDAVNMTTETKAATKVLYNGLIYILRGDEVYTITGAKVK